MMVSMPVTERMDLVFSCGNLETSIKATTLTMKEMAMERCSGQTDHSIKENGRLVYSMVMAR